MKFTSILGEQYAKSFPMGSTVATPVSWDEIVRPLDVHPDIEQIWRDGITPGISVGWSSFNPFFRLRPAEFTVITGHPGGGKSSWLDNLMVNVSHVAKWKWAVFSAENYPVSRHIRCLAEIFTGKPLRPIRMDSGAWIEGMTQQELRKSLEWLNEYFRFIVPKEDRYSLDRIVQIAIESGEANAIVVDPWNELDHSRPREMREDEFISLCLTKLRWFARTAELHVFVVAHPSKYRRDKNEPRPVATLNDCKGASEWFAKADNGISVWRDETDVTGACDVHIQKIRFRDTGRAGGVVRLYYNRATGRFSDPNHKPTVEEIMQKRTRDAGDEQDVPF